jgi:hypothetical protein
VIGLIWGQLVTSFLAFFINSYYSGKFINYSSWQQISDILPLILIAFIAGIIVYLVVLYLISYCTDLDKLIIGGVVGAGIYITLTAIFKKETFLDFKKVILRK